MYGSTSAPTPNSSSFAYKFLLKASQTPVAPLITTQPLDYNNNNNTATTPTPSLSHYQQPSEPSWLNPALIKLGQEFINQHFFAIYFAHLISLIFLFCYKPIRTILLITQKSDSSSKALQRYFNTLAHIKAWYEGDLINPSGETIQNIQRVRKLHCNLVAGFQKNMNKKKWQNKTNGSQASQQQITDKGYGGRGGGGASSNHIVNAVRKDLRARNKAAESCCYNGDRGCAGFTMNYLTCSTDGAPASESLPPISQLDMIITQFCFMGFVALYPRVFGISNCTGHSCAGIQGFVHIWALIGYHLGIEDQFNICLEGNEEVQLIIRDILFSSMETSSKKGEGKEEEEDSCAAAGIQLLWISLINGLSSFLPFLSLPAFLLFIMDKILQTKKYNRNICKVFDTYDWISYQLLSWCFNCWINYTAFALILNWLLQLAIYCISIRLQLRNKLSWPKRIKFLV